jgi:sugar phosphate isomerase/epimerase
MLDYCRTALTRCKALGGAVVVLGSAGARKVPDGFEHGEAINQFIAFCKELGPVAQDIDIIVAIEPLNRKEDNLILSVEQGAGIVDAVGHPNITLLADLYHMIEEGEPVANAGAAGTRLTHTHVADLCRVAPGYAPEGEADFLGFFQNLRRAGYDARCSFEGSFQDIATQSKPVIALLRQRWAESVL